MAKKNGSDFDDYDIDNMDDGLDDFDFDFDDVDSSNRKPIDRIKSGAKMGAKSTLDNPEFRKRFLKGALPKEYTAGIEGIENLTEELRQLYNTTSSEVKGAARDGKEFLSRVMPSASKYVPEALAKKLNDWMEEDKSSSFGSGYGDKNAEEAEIATTLGSIFKTQAEESAKREEQDDLRKNREKVVQRKQFAASQTILEKIRSLAQRQVAYQDTVTVAYQRKNLELQIRQYSVLRNIHNVMATFAEKNLKYQEAIKHNTGLPDFQKITLNESFRQNVRERMFGAISGGPLANVSKVMGGFASSLMNSASEGINNAMRGFRDAISMSEMAEGIDPLEMGASMAADGAMGLGGRRAGRFIRNRINRYAPNASRYGSVFSRIFGDPARMAASFKDGDNSGDYWTPQYDEDGNEIREGFFAKWGRRGRRLVREHLPGNDPNNLVVKKRNAALGEPDIITGRFTRTVEEVIPKLLTMIYGETRSLRTGQPISNISYDFGSRKFTQTSEATAALRGKLFNEDRVRNINSDIDGVYDSIVGDKKLSPSAEKVLRQRIISEARKGKAFTPKGFIDGKGWRDGTSPKDIAEIRSVMAGRFNIDKKGRQAFLDVEHLTSNTDSLLRGLSNSSPEVKNELIAYLRSGDFDAAMGTGLLKETEEGYSFDEDAYYDYLMTGKEPTGRDAGVLGGTGAKTGTRQVAVDRKVNRKNLRVPSPRTSGNMAGVEKRLDVLNLTMHNSSTDVLDRLSRIMEASEFSAMWLEEIASNGLGEGGGGAGGSGSSIKERMANGISGLSDKEAWSKLKQRFGIGARLRRGGRIARIFARRFGRRAAAFGGIAKDKALYGAAVGAQAGADLLDKAADLYVRGREAVALRAELMRNGEYVDVSTGKVIRKVSDITGEVRNKANQVIISAEEFAGGLYDDLRNPVVDAVDRARSFGGRLVRAAPGFLEEFKQQARSLIDGPQDVYVKGESEPRLYGTKMRKGMYVHFEDGSRIYRPTDIEGPVIDINEQILLTEDDLEKGLVDSKQRPFEGLGTRFGNTLRNIGDDLSEGALSLGRLARYAGGMALNAAGNLAEKFGGMSFPGIFIGGQRRVEDAINRIYNLIAPEFGGDPIESETPSVKKAGKKAKQFADWLREKGGQVQGGMSGMSERIREIRERRKGRGAGLGFSVPWLGGFVPAWMRTEQSTESDEARPGGWQETMANGFSPVDPQSGAVVDPITGALFDKLGDKDRGLADGAKGKVLSAWEKAKEMRDRQSGREGSWVDILKDREKQKELLGKAKDKFGRAKKGKGGLAGSIFSALWGIGGKLFGPIGGLFGLRGLFKGLMSAPKFIKMAGKGTWWLAKKGIPLLGKGIGLIGGQLVKGFLDVGRLLSIPLKGIWAATKMIPSIPGAIAKSVGKGGALRAAGGALMKGLGWAARGLLFKAIPAAVSVLASPVVLAVGAVAALAFGGYKLYKYLHRNDSAVTKTRLIQYGIDLDDEDMVNKIDQFEQAILPDVSVQDDGSGASLQISTKPQKLLEIFGISETDEEANKSFARWFSKRFQPVFLAHVKAFRKATSQFNLPSSPSDLTRADEVLDKWQLKYAHLSNVTLNLDDDGAPPTAYMDSPFPGKDLEWTHDGASTEVKEVLEYVGEKSKEEIEDEGPYQKEPGSGDIPTWSKSERDVEANKRREERQAAQQAAADKYRSEAAKRAEEQMNAAINAAKGYRGDREHVNNMLDKLRRNSRYEDMKDQGGNPGDWMWPTDPGHRISSLYGRRIHPVTGKPGGHGGIDIAAPEGTPIYAVADGSIIRRAFSDSYGYVIYIKHADGRSTRYAHMSRFEPGLEVGSKVVKGQIIGYVGNTGVGTGPHLHFEIRKTDAWDSATVDPLSVIQNPDVQKKLEEEKQAAKKAAKGEEAQYDDPEGSSMEGVDTIASTEAGESGTNTSQPTSSVVADAAKKAEQAKIEQERAKRAAAIDSTGAAATSEVAAARRRAQREAQEQQRIERSKAIANAAATAGSTGSMVEIGKQQLDAQLKILDGINYLVEADKQSREAAAKEKEKEDLPLGQNTAPRMRQHRRPSQQASATIPMK